jgi:hypothetical protein
VTEMAGTIDLRKARQVIEKKAAAPDHEVETSCVVCSHGRASSCTHGHDHVDQHPLDLMICDRYVRKILERDNTQKILYRYKEWKNILWSLISYLGVAQRDENLQSNVALGCCQHGLGGVLRC